MFQHSMQNAYIGEYVEETYTGSKGVYCNIYKSGYKVSKIEMQVDISSSSSSDTYLSSSLRASSSSSIYLGPLYRFGSGWGGYSASEGKYGAFIFEGWSNSIQFPNNATTSSRGTANIVITEDYAEIKIGKVYGTRDYTTTKTFNSTEKAKIQQIMTSSDVGVSLSNTNYTVVNKANYIVNYEKI